MMEIFVIKLFYVLSYRVRSKKKKKTLQLFDVDQNRHVNMNII